MVTIERTPKVNNGEISQKVNPSEKETLPVNKNINEIGDKEIEIPVSWDAACRV